MAAKLEVQVRHCFCCGLTPGAFLIGLYNLLFYALFTILASIALSDLSMNGDRTYEGCQQEVQGIGPDKRAQIQADHSKIVFVDTSSYHCSFGMYTEEMKFAKEGRSLALLIALCLFVPLILASLALMAGVAFRSPWLLLPWLILLPFDIIRGLISSILILIMSQGMLARIATGILFLAFQFLHISLWILVLAKFQRLRHRRIGPHPQYDLRQPFPPHQNSSYGGYYGGGPGYAYSPQSGRRVPVVSDEYPHPPPMNGQQHNGRQYSGYEGGGVVPPPPLPAAGRY